MLATRFTLHPRGPYSLPARARFLEGFAPAAHEAAPQGHLHLAFPGPEGEVADAGALDAVHLRSLPTDRALGELRGLPGIGPFSAELILLRGAGEADHLPAAEPRLRRAVALAYGDEDEPTQAEVVQRAERWRPYRTWVAVLLRAALEAQTGEIAGRPPH